MRHQKSILLIGLCLLTLSACTKSVKEAVDRILPVDASFLRPTIDPASVPDAKPINEPLSKHGNPENYEHDGQRYFLLPSAKGYIDRGLGTWYPTTRHGTATANQEIYDQYQMTAAHKTLPIPSYVQVTNLANQRTIVVRINDRGPWARDQIIELSYIAAAKLDMLGDKHTSVEVKALSGPNNKLRHLASTASNPTSMVRSQPLPHKKPQAQPLTQPLPPTKSIHNKAPLLSVGEENSPASNTTAASIKKSQHPTTRPVSSPSIKEAQPRSQPQSRPLSTQQAPRSNKPEAGYYVQVGAFSRRENAARLKVRLAKAELGTLQIFAGPSQHGTLHRVQIGPFSSLKSAKRSQAVVRELGIRRPKLVEY